ncbi:MAG: nicotinate (nicotinamide) nucleotide adenylyltransferase [Christensenellales bacterium]
MDYSELKGRVLFFGGAFNPVHNGHLMLLKEAASFCRPNGILLMPSGLSPHKPGPFIAPRHRLAMLKLAVRNIPGVYISDYEISRKKNSYTAETLDMLYKKAPGVSEWLLLLGGDSLANIRSWYRPERILSRVTPVVMSRPGYGGAELEAQCSALTAAYGCRVIRLPYPGPDISSSDIRHGQSAGEDPEGLPSDVLSYIRLYRLYEPCNYESRLAAAVKPSTFRHSLGVQETAIVLAKKWNVNAEQASLAGLLHDCAKGLPEEELLARLRQWGYPRLSEETKYLPVLHAPAGAYLAREAYGVEDEAVLNAIARHTVPEPEMTDLDKVIFLSDMIEPGRKDYPGLSALREEAFIDLRQAYVHGLASTISHCREKGMPVHPGTDRAYQLAISLQP